MATLVSLQMLKSLAFTKDFRGGEQLDVSFVNSYKLTYVGRIGWVVR